MQVRHSSLYLCICQSMLFRGLPNRLCQSGNVLAVGAPRYLAPRHLGGRARHWGFIHILGWCLGCKVQDRRLKYAWGCFAVAGRCWLGFRGLSGRTRNEALGGRWGKALALFPHWRIQQGPQLPCRQGPPWCLLCSHLLQGLGKGLRERITYYS